MIRMRTPLCVPLALLALIALQPLQAAVRPLTPKPSVDPKAKELLRQMSDYLGGLTSFRVHVQTTREVILPLKQELDSDHAFDIDVQRPDRMRVNVQSAAGKRQFVYDGQNVTVYTPGLKYYAVFPAPATIGGMFREATTKYGLHLPAADFLGANPYQALTKGVVSGIHVGMSMIDGTLCHQIAFRQKNVDWQLWIEDSDTPLPRKFVITDRAMTGSPRFTAVFSEWDTDPTFDASTFTFAPGEGDRKIDIVQMQDLRNKRLLKGNPMPAR
jgi:hypothetical protein